MEILALLLLAIIFGPPIAVAFGLGWFFGSRSVKRKMQEQVEHNWTMNQQQSRHLEQHQRWNDEYNGYSGYNRQQPHGQSTGAGHSPAPNDPTLSPRRRKSWYN